MKRISLENIVKAVEGQLLGGPSTFVPQIHKVVTDSRAVSGGSLYIPIIGERFDGHDFIQAAFEMGAALVFTDREMPLEKGQCAVLVKDTRIALGQLAGWYRSLFEIPVIGITGSVGKTSTKEMVSTILGRKFNVHKTSGNYNNDIGLPLTLLQLESNHDVAVVEMGMNHFGEIDYLAGILKPTIGMITNIGVSHIEFLGSREGILKAKTEMLPHIQPGGLVILNGDDDLLLGLTETFGNRRLLYGENGQLDASMIGHQRTQEGGQHMTVATAKDIYDVTVAYQGRHILHNALGGIVLGEALGLSKAEITAGIVAYKPSAMRLDFIELKEDVTLIDDAYNASVDSMGSALKTLTDNSSAHTIAILGSMFEMGDYAQKGHRDVGGMVATYMPTMLIAVGLEAKWIVEGAKEAGYPMDQIHYYETQESLFEDLLDLIQPGHTVLIKGSRGMKLERSRDKIMERYEAL